MNRIQKVKVWLGLRVQEHFFEVIQYEEFEEKDTKAIVAVQRIKDHQVFYLGQEVFVRNASGFIRGFDDNLQDVYVSYCEACSNRSIQPGDELIHDKLNIGLIEPVNKNFEEFKDFED